MDSMRRLESRTGADIASEPLARGFFAFGIFCALLQVS